jgi:hypothetical protein
MCHGQEDMDIRWQDLVHSPLAGSEEECVRGWMVQGKHAPCTPYATRRCYAGAIGGWHLRTHAEQADWNKRVDAVDTLQHNYFNNGSKKVDLI